MSVENECTKELLLEKDVTTNFAYIYKRGRAAGVEHRNLPSIGKEIRSSCFWNDTTQTPDMRGTRNGAFRTIFKPT